MMMVVRTYFPRTRIEASLAHVMMRCCSLTTAGVQFLVAPAGLQMGLRLDAAGASAGHAFTLFVVDATTAVCDHAHAAVFVARAYGATRRRRRMSGPICFDSYISKRRAAAI